MSDIPQIDYSAVLADLEARRAKLDAAIAGIREMLGLNTEHRTDTIGTHDEPASSELTPHSFFQLQIGDAIRKYLRIVRTPKSAKDIVEALQAGGLTSTSKNLYTTVYTTMVRDDERGGEIMKLNNGKWGLAVWYPGAQRKKKRFLTPDQEQQAADTDVATSEL